MKDITYTPQEARIIAEYLTNILLLTEGYDAIDRERFKDDLKYLIILSKKTI